MNKTTNHSEQQEKNCQNILLEIGLLQKEYSQLIQTYKSTNQNIMHVCEPVISFQQKYHLTNKQALSIAKNNISILEMNEIIEKAQEIFEHANNLLCSPDNIVLECEDCGEIILDAKLAELYALMMRDDIENYHMTFPLKSVPIKKAYTLISVCNRTIVTEEFHTLAAAQECMLRELQECQDWDTDWEPLWKEYVAKYQDEYCTEKFGIGEKTAWANSEDGNKLMDWCII